MAAEGRERARIIIRPAGTADAAALAQLVCEFARAEGKTAEPLPAERIARWLGGADPAFEALVAAQAARIVGYLAYYRAFSLIKPGPVLLVENLYVVRDARGRGVGRRLLAAAAAEAVARGWPRLELNVRAGNPEADRFYAALGFETPGECVRRLEDGALAALAASAAGGDAAS